MTDNSKLIEEHSPVVVYDGPEVKQAVRMRDPETGQSGIAGYLNPATGRYEQVALRLFKDIAAQGPAVHEGIEHVQSGIHVTVFENGHLLIEGYGSAQHGDPLPGMEVSYDPDRQTLRVQNKVAITRNGNISEHEGLFGRPAARSFPVTFSDPACPLAADALLRYDGDMPAIRPATSCAAAETGHFMELRGGRGTLEVEIRDPGVTMHSSICVRYICPVTGHGLRLVMDENTALIHRQCAADSMEQAIVEFTGDVFPHYDVRHQKDDTSTRGRH